MEKTKFKAEFVKSNVPLKQKRKMFIKQEQVPTSDGLYVLNIDGELTIGATVTIKDTEGNEYSQGIFVIEYQGQELEITVIDNAITDIQPVQPQETPNETPTETTADSSMSDFQKFANEITKRLDTLESKINSQFEKVADKAAVTAFVDKLEKLAFKFDKFEKSTHDNSENLELKQMRKKFNL
jgi:antitoxin (DNA-binding transcriptional repressor) of toxin-antitoxin stability system